jgi:hypothetical protein
MDTTFLIIVIIASFVLAPLALLFVGGQLIRGNMDRGRRPVPARPRCLLGSRETCRGWKMRW